MLKRQRTWHSWTKVPSSELDTIRTSMKLYFDIFPVGMALYTIRIPIQWGRIFLQCRWVRLTTGHSHESISNSTQQLQALVELVSLPGLQNESNVCTYHLVVLQFACKQLLHPVSWTHHHRQSPRHYWCTTLLYPLVHCSLPLASVHHECSLIQEWKALQYEVVWDTKYTIYARKLEQSLTKTIYSACNSSSFQHFN